MQISLSDCGKRFNRDWIFRKFSFQFNPNGSYAITGPNGSGKSTLLQCIAGAVSLSEGNIYASVHPQARENHGEGITPDTLQPLPPAVDKSLISAKEGNSTVPVEPENIFKYISIAAPYQEVIEEMTLLEFLSFHHKFKPFISSLKIDEIVSIINLQKAAGKQIRYFSSGMKQRVKLAQAIFSDTSCVLLDEPCTNLDIDGINLYHQLINNYCLNRMVIVSSNDIQEYGFCKEIISITDYKSAVGAIP